MTKTIELGPDLRLPVDVASEADAYLGRRGGGKTYGAGKGVEGLLEAGVQVGIIDQVGKWYGLRLAADGVHPSPHKVVILGGLRGDVPLAPEGGPLVAELLVSSGQSMIIDVSQFSKTARKRFCTDFGEKLWELKKAERDPSVVKIVLEEAQLIVPQRIDSDVARMFGTWEEIVRLGRNHGIGCTLISQRPQSVNKEVLSQVEIVFAFQMTGAQDRKAMKEWIEERGGDVHLVDELPKLQKGEAYLWSPQLLGEFRRVRIGLKSTYDSTATPKVGQRKVDRAVKPIDLGDLKEKMAAVREQAEKNDPGALHRRIRQLETELAKKPAAAAPAPAPKEKRVEVPVLKDSQVEKLAKVAETLRQAAAAITEGLAKAQQRPPPAPVSRVHEGRVYPSGQAAHREHPRRAQVATSDGPVPIKRGAREMLKALASRHPKPLTRDQVAMLAGLSASSGTFGDYLSALRRSGFIGERGSQVEITAAGLEFLGPDIPRQPASTEELVALWSSKLKAGARRMLDSLVAAYPRPMTRAELGDLAGISPSSGTFGDYLSAIRRAGLLDERDGQVRASDDLFP